MSGQPTQQQEIRRVSREEMENRFLQVLLKAGLNDEKAQTCARVFTENSLDGIYTHGVNRFPRFIQYIKDGHIAVDAEPVLLHSFAGVEQWDGKSGPGILNALFCTERVQQLASQSGIGCVAIGNTNHWMRGGTYGWKAAKAGYAFICFTNTIKNMPPWGARESRLGNNPLIIAVPFEQEAVVLDMAMSQFSFGKVELTSLKGETLPVEGGFDSNGEPTKAPAAIMESNLLLPAGYWKGSGLALLLDILAAILSGGLATVDISKQTAEINVSQVFIAIDLSKLSNSSAIQQTLQSIIADYKNAQPAEGKSAVRYPGEAVVKTRKENLENGIPVIEKVWNEILAL